MSSIWQLCLHWWYCMLSKWQLTVPPVTTNLSNSRYFVFSYHLVPWNEIKNILRYLVITNYDIQDRPLDVCLMLLMIWFIFGICNNNYCVLIFSSMFFGIISALLTFCEGNSPAVEFPSQRPATRSFDVSFGLRLNHRLSKQSRRRWFETPSRSSRRHCNGLNNNRVLFGISESDKQRVLMHRHQGWNVRHGLCHIYMRYLYIYELFIAFVCFVVCSLL